MPPKKWKKRDKMTIELDPTMTMRPTDIIILVMGQTGSGKSTFINLLLGEDTVTVGHKLESCTSNVNPIVIEASRWTNPSPDPTPRRLIIVDTPGFDHTYLDDSEILRRISVWLAALYYDSIQLAGVILLYDISQTQMARAQAALINPDIIGNLCGYDILKFVVIGTTKWELVGLAEGQARESALRSLYWEDMVDKNAQMLPIRNTISSAWNTVNAVLIRHTKYSEFMQIPKESSLPDFLKQSHSGHGENKLPIKIGSIGPRPSAAGRKYLEMLKHRRILLETMPEREHEADEKEQNDFKLYLEDHEREEFFLPSIQAQQTSNRISVQLPGTIAGVDDNNPPSNEINHPTHTCSHPLSPDYLSGDSLYRDSLTLAPSDQNDRNPVVLANALGLLPSLRHLMTDHDSSEFRSWMEVQTISQLQPFPRASDEIPYLYDLDSETSIPYTIPSVRDDFTLNPKWRAEISRRGRRPLDITHGKLSFNVRQLRQAMVGSTSTLTSDRTCSISLTDTDSSTSTLH